MMAVMFVVREDCIATILSIPVGVLYIVFQMISLGLCFHRNHCLDFEKVILKILGHGVVVAFMSSKLPQKMFWNILRGNCELMVTIGKLFGDQPISKTTYNRIYFVCLGAVTSPPLG